MANILATTAALSQSLERWFTLISSPWRYYQPLVLFASLEVCTLLLRQFGMISARIALLLSSSPGEFFPPLKGTLLNRRKYSFSLFTSSWTLLVT
jgi:hypothetical protein